jgi:hypothetical protein
MTYDAKEAHRLEPTLELVNDEIKDKLTRQSEAAARVDTKAGIIVGFAITVVQLFIPELTRWWLALPAIAAYVTAVVFGVMALAVRAHQDPPDPTFLAERYTGKSRYEALGALIGTRAEAYRVNSRNNETRVRFWWLSLGALIAAVGLSGVDLLVERIIEQ